MQNMNRKKIALIIGLAVLFIVALVIVLLSQKDSQPVREIEKGAGPSVKLIDPENKLYNAFTTTDFTLVRGGMTNYVISTGGDGYTDTIEVIEVSTPFREGTETTIKTKITSQKNREVVFVANIPSSAEEMPRLLVPAENYSAPLTENE
jgi:uncharacterized protein YpmB